MIEVVTVFYKLIELPIRILDMCHLAVLSNGKPLTMWHVTLFFCILGIIVNVFIKGGNWGVRKE